MLSPNFDKIAASPMGKLLWAAIGVLVVGQLITFWMLCSQQVQKAHMRDASQRVQRVAVADCLRHAPGATKNSCAGAVSTDGRWDSRSVMAASQGRGEMNSTVPVNFVFR